MSRISPLNRQDVPELERFLSATEKRMGFVPNSQLVMAHKPKLLQAFSNANVEDQKIAAVGQYDTSPFFNEAERAALRFAQRAAAVPNAVTGEDFATLRKHYSDEEIVELVSVIAYFGFLNRWNDTLATELESSPLNFAQCALCNTGWSAGKHSPKERTQEAAAENAVPRFAP